MWLRRPVFTGTNGNLFILFSITSFWSRPLSRADRRFTTGHPSLFLPRDARLSRNCPNPLRMQPTIDPSHVVLLLCCCLRSFFLREGTCGDPLSGVLLFPKCGSSSSPRSLPSEGPCVSSPSLIRAPPGAPSLSNTPVCSMKTHGLLPYRAAIPVLAHRHRRRFSSSSIRCRFFYRPLASNVLRLERHSLFSTRVSHTSLRASFGHASPPPFNLPALSLVKNFSLRPIPPLFFSFFFSEILENVLFFGISL